MYYATQIAWVVVLHSTKCILECHLHYVCHFVSFSMLWKRFFGFIFNVPSYLISFLPFYCCVGCLQTFKYAGVIVLDRWSLLVWMWWRVADMSSEDNSCPLAFLIFNLILSQGYYVLIILLLMCGLCVYIPHIHSKMSIPSHNGSQPLGIYF